MSKVLQKKVKEIKDNRDEYVQLERFVDVVRDHPGMWIGPVGLKGVLNMFREIFQNSGDQMLREDSPCDHIIVSFKESECLMRVADNGFGVAFGIMEKVFSTPNVSSNYKKTPFKFTSGRHGVGSKVTNVLSRTFIVQSFTDPNGDGHEVRFEEGECIQEETPIPNPDNMHGTIVTFSPSEFMWREGIKAGIQEFLTAECLLEYLQALVPQLPIGAKVIFEAEKVNGERINEILINEDGIFTHLYAATTTPLITPIHIFDNTDGTHKAEIAFTFSMEMSYQGPYIVSFANTCPVTNKSTHVVGFENGLVSWFRKYMNNIFLSGKKNNKIQINASDIKDGLVCAMSVFHLEPNFEGQAKDALANADMVKYMSDLVQRGLDEWHQKNPKDLNKVCDYLYEMATIRYKTDQDKEKITNKFKSSSTSGMPKKYARPSGTEDLEFWIVEGDSAFGSAKVARNKANQGVFPIRGKLPNALTTKREEFLKNTEVQAILTIVGCGYGKNFDITKLKWKRIVFGADADAQWASLNLMNL